MIFTSTAALVPMSVSEGWVAENTPANSPVSESILVIEKFIVPVPSTYCLIVSLRSFSSSPAGTRPTALL